MRFKNLKDYIKAGEKYIENYSFYLNHTEYEVYEYVFVRRLVEKLSCLTTPYALADFLKINIDIIFDALEDNLIPHIAYDDRYAVKTEKLIPFLRKHYF